MNRILRTTTCLVFAALVLAGCGKREAGGEAAAPNLPSIPVRVQTVQSKKLPAVEEVVGTVRAKTRATLEAKVSGRIVQLPVVLGQKVKAGDVVALLDAAEIKARLDQAQAALQQAERDWKRLSALFGQQAITRSEYDAADARYEVAKAGVAEAKAMMAYLTVPAPFDGVVTRKWAEAGDLAAPAKPLVDIEDPAALQMEADVPEAIAGLIRAGSQMTIRVEAVAGSLSGTVSEIAPSADPISRTFRVKLDLPDAPAASSDRASRPLMSGQFARLLVPVGETTSLRVPGSAVVQRGQMEIVFVAANQRANLHLVKTGRRLDGEIEILSGLDDGDAVVVEGAAQLADGQTVTAR